MEVNVDKEELSIRKLEKSKFYKNLKLKNLNEFSLNELNLDEIIRLIKKPIQDKKIEDIQIIYNYLQSTELLTKFRKENMSDSTLIKLLSFCAVYMQFELKEDKKFLFKQGDFADKFYLIIKGKVNVIRAAQKLKQLTAFEYFTHIVNLHSESHFDLLSKTIKENLDIFLIELKEISFLKEALFLSEIMKYVNDNKNINKSTIDEIFEKYNKKSNDYGFDYDEIDFTKGSFSMINKIKTYLIKNTLIYPCNRYYEEINKNEKFLLTLYDYETFLVLNQGQFFGDFALDNNSKLRSASIQSNGEVLVGVVTNKIYGEYLKLEKQKIRKKDINFLNHFPFFSMISFAKFDQKFYSNFTSHEYSRGKYLYNERDDLNFIYFIKEGEIEIFFKKNFTELCDDLNLLESIYTNRFNIHTDFDTKSSVIENEIKKNNFYQKRNYQRILIRIRNKMIGFLEYNLNLKSLFNAVVSSDKATLFRIHVNDLERITKSELSMEKSIELFLREELKTIIDRLEELKKVFIKSYLNEKISRNNELKGEIKSKAKEGGPIFKINSTIFRAQASNRSLTNLLPNIIINSTKVDHSSRNKNMIIKDISKERITEKSTSSRLNNEKFEDLMMRKIRKNKLSFEKITNFQPSYSKDRDNQLTSISVVDLNIRRNKENCSSEIPKVKRKIIHKNKQNSENKIKINPEYYSKEIISTIKKGDKHISSPFKHLSVIKKNSKGKSPNQSLY